MRILMVVLFVFCVGCGGPEGELKDKVAELGKAPKADNISDAVSALKDANDLVGEIEKTEKEEGEKYPEAKRQAKALRNKRLSELKTVGGDKVKNLVTKITGQIDSGQPVDLSPGVLGSILNPNLTPEQKQRLGPVPKEPRSDRLEEWSEPREKPTPTKKGGQ